jgi:hypothetical protein
MSPVPCFRPSYYPRPYAPPPATDFGDLEAFAAVAARLAATGEFAAVLLGPPSVLDELAADLRPAALISPTGWAERDDLGASAVVRHVSYDLTLGVRREDVGERYCLLERLSTVAQNALIRSGLDGPCPPALSRLDRGRFELSARGDEGRATLSGGFGYLVANPTSRVP